MSCYHAFLPDSTDKTVAVAQPSAASIMIISLDMVFAVSSVEPFLAPSTSEEAAVTGVSLTSPSTSAGAATGAACGAEAETASGAFAGADSDSSAEA